MCLYIPVQLIDLPPGFSYDLMSICIDALPLGPRLSTVVEHGFIHLGGVCGADQLHLVLVLQDSSYEVVAVRLTKVE